MFGVEIEFKSLPSPSRGIIIYQNKDQAEETIRNLRSIENGEVTDSEECLDIIQQCFTNHYGFIDETDAKFESAMKDVTFDIYQNGLLGTETHDVEVLNYGCIIGVYDK